MDYEGMLKTRLGDLGKALIAAQEVVTSDPRELPSALSMIEKLAKDSVDLGMRWCHSESFRRFQAGPQRPTKTA
jgi:hypothetical protein